MAATMVAWMTIAYSLLGTREAPGAANNATILGWAKKLGLKVLGMVYNADSTPWCGLFVAHCMREAGIDLESEGRNQMKIGVRASAWADWGSNLRDESLALGAVLVFQRPGGGHVGFYVGEGTVVLDGVKTPAYRVLGGNQSDNVTQTWIAKSRCVARRWPYGVPVSPKKIMLAANGEKLSTNEA